MSSTDETFASPQVRVGSLVADRFRVIELLGSGGMGAVYSAEHVHMRKLVALKVLHRQMTYVDEVVKRFEREAVAVGQIDHPNIVAASDFGRTEDGALYLVLEYVRGQALSQLVAQGPLPAPRALHIARQIASALGAAHERGIVHRDLKPDNVMLVERAGTSDFVKVLDFGIAKLSPETGRSDTQLTQIGAIFGTPQYMAPEQAVGKAVDHRADLYALGLLLYEMLSGKPAFASDDTVALLMQQLTAAPAALPAGVPAPLGALVLQLLEKEPERRPATAAEVEARLAELLEETQAGLALARTEFVRSAPSPSPAPWAMAASQQREGRGGAALVRQVRGWAERAEPLLRRLGAQARRGLDRANQLGRRRVAGRVPIWALALTVLVAGMGVTTLVSSDAEPTDPKPAAPATLDSASAADSRELAEAELEDAEPERDPDDARELDPALQRVLAAARRGSHEALYAIEQRPEDRRTKHEWLALAQGKLRTRQVKPGLAAYRRALALDPALAQNSTMLGYLRYFAEKDAYTNLVLDFAAQELGRSGADLLFHVWFSTSRVTNATQLAKKHLDTAPVRQQGSEALRMALSLRQQLSCQEYAALLPEARRVADERSLGPLRDLMKTDGCGPERKDDCWACLRGTSLLKDTITEAQLRKAPLFRVRRFR